jgi:hypothetical protein
LYNKAQKIGNKPIQIEHNKIDSFCGGIQLLGNAQKKSINQFQSGLETVVLVGDFITPTAKTKNKIP